MKRQRYILRFSDIVIKLDKGLREGFRWEIICN